MDINFTTFQILSNGFINKTKERKKMASNALCGASITDSNIMHIPYIKMQISQVCMWLMHFRLGCEIRPEKNLLSKQIIMVPDYIHCSQ